MDSNENVTDWIDALERGDQDAAARLWEKYSPLLAAVARDKLGPVQLGAADEQDVALSAFFCFCRRVQEGRFERPNGRENASKFLATIARCKAISLIRRETAAIRGGGQPRGEAYLDEVPHPEPTREAMAELFDELRNLLDGLRDEDGTLFLIVQRKLEGYENKEIADELSVSIRTVQRKLERIFSLYVAYLNEQREGD